MRKTATPREIPPPLELECLKALWEIGAANVREVRGVVTRERELAYTTVMTILERLAKKGHVMRRKVGRSFVYEPRLSRDHVLQVALHDFLRVHFDGSEERLLEYLQSPPARVNAAAAGEGPA